MKAVSVLSFALAFLFVINSANAFTVSVTNVNRSAFEGQALNYTLNITNDLNRTDRVTYFDLIVISSFRVMYTPSSRVTISPNQSTLVNISIQSTDNTPLAIEVPFKIYLSSDYGGRSEALLKGRFDKMPVISNPVKPVVSGLDIADSLDPRTAHVLIATIYNPDDKIVEAYLNYSVNKDEDIIFSGSVNSTLEPLTNNRITIPIDLSYYQEPGNYSFTLRAYNQNYSYPANNTYFQVGGFAEYDIKPSVKQSILGKIITVSVTNTGTAIGTTNASISIVPLERIFRYQSDGNITYKDGSLIFIATVLPGQTKELVYRVTYIPLLASPFVLLFAFFLFRHLNRKVEVRRIIVNSSVSDDDFMFKIMIKIRNISNDKIKDIRVKEKLLPFAKKVGNYGTLSPKMIKDSTGKKLLWEIDELQSGDEAVITYGIKTSVGILGNIILPPTFVRFKAGGATKSASSSVLVVSPDLEEK